MTNQDVIKMVKAGLDEGIIITSIQNSEPKFDASPDGLIGLGEANVPKPIVTAIIERSSGKGAISAQADAPAAAAQNVDPMSPSDVLLIDSGEPKMLQYSKLQIRTAARGMGFGGVASYCVIHGARAATRITNKQPEFLLCIPERAQPAGAVELVNFAIRKNGTREVMTGGGYASYSTGFPPDRVVALKYERADQAKAPRGFVLYRAIPQKPLVAGEYAVVVNSNEALAAMVPTAGGSCYDFGVDR